jgi:hypothetical protein
MSGHRKGLLSRSELIKTNATRSNFQGIFCLESKAKH